MLKFGNDILKVGNDWIDAVDYNPLNLPSHTIRLLYEDDVVPRFSRGTAVQVSESPNIWDLTYEDNHWGSLLSSDMTLLEVLGANATGVTNMAAMFYYCGHLRKVALFDTSAVTSTYSMFYYCSHLVTIPLFRTTNVTCMREMFINCYQLETVPLLDMSNVTESDYMFGYCRSLKSIPLFNTSSIYDMHGMFYNCPNVETGALALYQQASSQAIPPQYHNGTFYNCGKDTTTGAAELAQIPSDWKQEFKP